MGVIMMENHGDNILVLYLFFILISIFIIFGYFIIKYNSIESYVIMVICSDALLWYCYDFLSNNQYKLFNWGLNFTSLFNVDLGILLILTIYLFPK